VIFPQSPVFCALGSSVMDIMHVYEVSKRMVFMEAVSEKFTTDYESYNTAVRGLVEQARIDLTAEGLAIDTAIYQVELDMLYGGQVHVKRVSVPHLAIESEQQMQEIYAAFEKEFSEAFSPHVVHKPGGVYLENIILKATVPTEKLALPEQPMNPPDASAAGIGTRDAYWPALKRRVETSVYRFEDMQPGYRIEGPSLVDAEFTTLVVPPGQVFHIDSRGLGILEYTTAPGDAR
jgi:N-methylhydantoinase A/oxoprolinase/acetone carboxylase beta subunit